MTKVKSTTDWRSANARKLQAEIAAMTRPEGCSSLRWRCVKALLAALVEYLPDPYPGQDTLAVRLEVSVPTIKRWLSWAVEMGVLVVTRGPSTHGHWPTNRYHLIGISTGDHNDPPSVAHIDPLSSSYSRMKKRLPLPSEGEVKKEVSVDSVAGRRTMSDYDPSFSETDTDRSDLHEPRVSQPRRRTPVGHVTAHFRDGWDKELAKPGGNSLSMTVLFDSVAAFQTRVKQDCFEREGKTVEEVCMSIDLFLHQISVGRVLPKQGQPLWKLWWNQRARYQRPVVDEADLHRPSTEDIRRRLQKHLDAPLDGSEG